MVDCMIEAHALLAHLYAGLFVVCLSSCRLMYMQACDAVLCVCSSLVRRPAGPAVCILFYPDPSNQLLLLIAGGLA